MSFCERINLLTPFLKEEINVLGPLYYKSLLLFEPKKWKEEEIKPDLAYEWILFGIWENGPLWWRWDWDSPEIFWNIWVPHYVCCINLQLPRTISLMSKRQQTATLTVWKWGAKKHQVVMTSAMGPDKIEIFLEAQRR